MFAAAAAAKREVVRVGDLFLVDNGGVSPSKLPRHRQVPISAHIAGEIGTTDGTHPPAVRRVTVDFDKTFQLNARGLPACPFGRLEARPTTSAKQACPKSIVGSGQGEVEVEFAESKPFTAKGPIVIFSGGVHSLYIHTYVSVPAPTAVVARVAINKIHRGHFGLHTVTEVPRIAGGAGSVTKFNLTIERSFTYKGRRVSYLTGSCPTGHYFTEGKAEFADGRTMGLKHVLPCTPSD
jgi:hypothetical protein